MTEQQNKGRGCTMNKILIIDDDREPVSYTHLCIAEDAIEKALNQLRENATNE